MVTAPQKSARSIFLFHIPKTGGTAVFSTFRQALGPEHTLQIGDTDPDRMLRRMRYHLDHHQIYFFRGHVSPDSLEGESRLLRTVVLREPFERMISHFCFVYKHRHRQKEDYNFFRQRAHYRNGKFTEEDVEDWIRARHHDNTQTRFLGLQREGVLHDDALERAKRTIDSCDVTGVTERLGAYMALLAKVSGHDVEKPVRANAASRDILDIDPDALRIRLAPYISFDAKLYEYTRARFERTLLDHPELANSPLLARPELARPWTLRERLADIHQSSARELWTRVRTRYWQFRNRQVDTRSSD